MKVERLVVRYIKRRRICWPDFDGVCLQGGCGYCNESRFRAVTSIRKAVLAKMKSGAIDESSAGMSYLESFEWGLAHNFANADVEWQVDR